MVVKILPVTVGAPVDKLADAELVFDDGALAGMRLVGFSIWRNVRSGGDTCSVTFPSRQYMVNGERRSYALLRPAENGGSQEGLRLLILSAYAEYERQSAIAEVAAPALAESTDVSARVDVSVDHGDQA